MDFVIDCSTVCGFLLEDENNLYADKVLSQLQAKKAIAPSLILFELVNVLYIAHKKERCTVRQIEYLINLFEKLSINIYQFDSIREMKEVLDISIKHKLSSYDASYLYLSKKLKIPLATLDKELIKAASAKELFFNI